MEFKLKVAIVVAALFVRCSASWMMETHEFAAAEFESADEGGRWWAPSRKAPLYAHKYQSLMAHTSAQHQRQGDEFRLPSNLIPISYALVLTPIIEPGNFSTLGTVDIYVNCTMDTTDIVLNSADLVVHQSSIKVKDVEAGIDLRMLSFVDEQKTREMITIKLATPALMMAGRQYKISIGFISFLNDDLMGFYRSTYQENGVNKYLAITQFEATDARRSFPCFDEPNLKATFSVTLGRKRTMNSISNMPLQRNPLPHPDLPDYFFDSYQTSVKMPTYLVAMMVSEFVKVPSDPSLSPGVAFNVVTRPGLESQAKYAGLVGPKILNFFSKTYFGIDYPLPKVDMAAIPDFAAGAMENWGLITYREADLLFDEQRSTERSKQRVTAIIAHELGHQWFGNLVTMDWWNVLWLNEGFASYIEYVGSEYAEPTFGMDDQFVVADLQYAFRIDGLETSRPISMEVNTPDEINQMFDAISYEKGSSILRMCANFIGLDTFRRGVTAYLNKNAYGNTVQDHLWSSLQMQADADGVSIPFGVKAVMESWTNKMGYPVVTVTRNYQTGKCVVTQQRFLLRKSNRNNGTTDNIEYLWHIPLTYTKDFNLPTQTSWLSTTSAVTNLLANSQQWVIVNVDQVGYYRVAYDETNLKLIIQQLLNNHRVIGIKNRAQLLDDYFNLARAGMTPYSNALDLSSYLVHERDSVPWTAASESLSYIDTMLHDYPGYALWKDYVTELITKLYDHVKFTPGPNDSHLQVYTRSTALNWACVKLGLPDCVAKAKSLYSNWMKNPSNDNTISPNLRWIVSCTAVANGGLLEWNFIYGKYNASQLGSEKVEYLRAMGCSKNPTVISNTLELIINPNSGIRLQDVQTLFNSIASHPIGHQLALDYLTNRWDDIYKYFSGFRGFGSNGNVIGFFRVLCNRVNNPAKLNALAKVLNDHMDVFNTSKSMRQGFELAQANVQWTNDFYVPVTGWLQTRKYGPAYTKPTSSADNVGYTTTMKTTPTTTARAPTQKKKKSNAGSIRQDGLTMVLGLVASMITGCWMRQ